MPWSVPCYLLASMLQEAFVTYFTHFRVHLADRYRRHVPLPFQHLWLSPPHKQNPHTENISLHLQTSERILKYLGLWWVGEERVCWKRTFCFCSSRAQALPSNTNHAACNTQNRIPYFLNTGEVLTKQSFHFFSYHASKDPKELLEKLVFQGPFTFSLLEACWYQSLYQAMDLF